MTPRSAMTAFVLPIAMLVICAQHAFARSSESVLYSFGATQDDGAYPQDSLVADKAGNLYGTTALGGNAADDGVVFMIGTDGVLSIIHRFQGAPGDGMNPNTALTIDKNGNLYGTTPSGGAHGSVSGGGGGTVFQLVPAGGGAWTENILYNFCSKKKCADGDTPIAPVVLAPDGTLYGTTEFGGSGAALTNRGTVFRLAPPASGGAWKETVLYDFCSQPNCTDGAYPFAGKLLLSKSGTLYGTTYSSDHGGTLFALATDGSGFQVLHDFGSTSGDGLHQLNGVIADPDGVLYGMTAMGGAQSCGTAYSFDPSSSVYQTFHSFCAAAGDASFPEGGFVLLDGKRGPTLYGMSLGGGANNKGTIFKFRPSAAPGGPWTEKLLYSFCSQANCADGAGPDGGALLRLNGAFYGMVNRGGTNDKGVVYRFGKN